MIHQFAESRSAEQRRRRFAENIRLVANYTVGSSIGTVLFRGGWAHMSSLAPFRKTARPPRCSRLVLLVVALQDDKLCPLEKRQFFEGLGFSNGICEVLIEFGTITTNTTQIFRFGHATIKCFYRSICLTRIQG
jgi:hypothetical protein